MRHLAGIALAIVAAVVVFFGGGWGYLRLLRLPPANGSVAGLPAAGGSLLSNHHVLASFGALLGVGLVIGLLIAIPRVSPLASGLPGLALLALTGLYLASVRHAVNLIPMRTRVYGAGFEAMLIDGVLALAGLAMVIPLFVPSRWQSRGSRARAEDTGPATGLLSSDPATIQQGSYFPEPDQFPTQGLPVQHDPFPPQESPFPPQQ
jgi:hypothetical protein